VAAELARQSEGLDSDPQVYPTLARAESEVLRDLARLAPFSDSRAPAVRVLNRQRVALERALRALEKSGLHPDLPTHGQDKPDDRPTATPI
jgi:hypothetical protein